MWQQLKDWLKNLWEVVRVLAMMDVRVFDDPGTITGAPLQSETLQMIDDATRRAGVTSKK